MSGIKVEAAEFRDKVASFMEAATPVTVTKQGETIGLYIPLRPQPTRAELDDFLAAGERLDAELEAAGVTGEELIGEFEASRRAARKS